jgi:hypothetical protein
LIVVVQIANNIASSPGRNRFFIIVIIFWEKKMPLLQGARIV